VGELLGHGGFGEVHKATYRGETVAVKQLLRRADVVTASLLEEFRHEVGVLRYDGNGSALLFSFLCQSVEAA